MTGHSAVGEALHISYVQDLIRRLRDTAGPHDTYGIPVSVPICDEAADAIVALTKNERLGLMGPEESSGQAGERSPSKRPSEHLSLSLLVSAYLAAIVLANLSVAHWGPSAAIYNAFLFIGLDLTCRDRLHDLWHGRLLRNMAVLIAAGSVLSYLAGLWLGTGPFVGRIALASCIAFAAAASADAVVYHLLRDKGWYERVNQSNMAGAAVDSLVFVALWPFGFNFTLAFTLFAAKVAGGVVWSFILRESPGAAWMRRNRLLWGRS